MYICDNMTVYKGLSQYRVETICACAKLKLKATYLRRKDNDGHLANYISRPLKSWWT